ncbi:extensin-like [Equus quagga]|uniref:extensin-like n=1 Tax=Equus quagga TaxID=89248 RepID=UPI001EE21F7F|nr:extensin-like [Equus quagga]
MSIEMSRFSLQSPKDKTLKQKPHGWDAPEDRGHRPSSRAPSSLGQLGRRGGPVPTPGSPAPGISERTRRPPRGKTESRRRPPQESSAPRPASGSRSSWAPPDHSGVRYREASRAPLRHQALGPPAASTGPPTRDPQPSRPTRPDAEASRYRVSVRPASSPSSWPRPRSLTPPPLPPRFPDNLLALPARHARCARPPLSLPLPPPPPPSPRSVPPPFRASSFGPEPEV